MLTDKPVTATVHMCIGCKTWYLILAGKSKCPRVWKQSAQEIFGSEMEQWAVWDIS